MKKAMIISASGIGDAVIMMTAAHSLFIKGYNVTMYHQKSALFADLFPNVQWTSLIDMKQVQEYDYVIIENDHGKLCHDLNSYRNRHPSQNILFFHHKASSLYKEGDLILDRSYSFVQNILKFFDRKGYAQDCNGLTWDKQPQPTNKVIIHPLSQDKRRNFPKNRYEKLARYLQKKGYKPTFMIHESEEFTSSYPVIKNTSFEEMLTALSDSILMIGNDSGPGHVASNLGIKTVTLSGNPKHIQVWKPGFSQNITLTPFFQLPNFKGLNFCYRDRYWHHWISDRRIQHAIDQLLPKERL